MTFQGQFIRVTSSFGVAGFHDREPREFGALVQMADRMLYEAKHAGRNLIKVSYPEGHGFDAT
jgi:diguanylate cyclase (GGDEF)-like protein